MGVLTVRETVRLFRSYYPCPLPLVQVLALAGLEEVAARLKEWESLQKDARRVLAAEDKPPERKTSRVEPFPADFAEGGNGRRRETATRKAVEGR